MKIYWLLVSALVLFSALSVYVYHVLLKRSKSIAYRFFLQLAVIWVCALMPLWGINILYRQYHSDLFFGARGVSITVLMITAFVTHIVLLARQE